MPHGHRVALLRTLQVPPTAARFGRGVVLCAEGTPGGEDDRPDAKKLRPAVVSPESDMEQLLDVGMRFDGFWALLDAWGRSGLSEKARPRASSSPLLRITTTNENLFLASTIAGGAEAVPDQPLCLARASRCTFFGACCFGREGGGVWSYYQGCWDTGIQAGVGGHRSVELGGMV